MSDQNVRGPAGHVQAPYGGPGTTAAPHRFIDQASSVSGGDERSVEPQAGLGLYTLREWIVIALGLALTVLSFFSTFSVDVVSGYTPVWGIGITGLGAAFFPFAAVLLIALRRFVPRLRNLGALSLDQLASVAFAVAAFVWLNLGLILLQVSAAIDDLFQQMGALFGGVDGMFGSGSPLRAGVIVWIAFVVALAGVFFTVFARFIPPFSADFVGREQTVAHPSARPARPLAKRVRPAAPAWPAPAPAPHGGPYHPAHDPSAAPSSATPATGAGAMPAPRADGAMFGQGAPGPYGQHQPLSYGQETAPPYAQSAPAPYPQDALASDGQTPEQGAAVSADQPRSAEVFDATPLADEAADPAASETGSVEPAETHDAAPSGTERVTPDPEPGAPVADIGASVADSTRAPETESAPDSGTVAEDASAPVADLESDEAAASADPVVTFDAPPATETPADLSAAPAPDAAVADPVSAEAAVSASASAPAPDASPQAAATPQPFWALAPVERDVHDFDGNPIYRVGPTAWALVLEDRGSYFVMRHDDGRIGYLHDTSGITRG